VNADFTAEELDFQQEVRTFLQEEFSGRSQAQKSTNNIRLTKDDMVRWQKILFDKGWAAPTWPVEHGGTGWESHSTAYLRHRDGFCTARPNRFLSA
jgi:alkylation response protein AidB-like acyl-CoA dehydrogenase